MPKKETKPTRPEKLIIGGVPYQLIEHPYTGEDRRQASNSDYIKQEISITEGVPFPRWLSYLTGEITYRLLDAAGQHNPSPTSRRLGPVLYRFFRENKFDWINTDATGEPPTTLFVNGLPYVLKTDYNDYLDARNLCGEVDYAKLEIRLHSDLKAEPRALVFLHEATHALLYEARLLELCNKESLIEPFSVLLFQLFKQNDFNFAYNGD